MVGRFLLAWLLLAAVTLAGCSSSAPAVAEVPDDVGPVSAEPVVAVLDNIYEPEDLVVEVGTAVTWVWEGRAAHDAVGDGFDSGVQGAGTFTHTFEEPGAYGYVCTLHPGMDGTVFVVDPSTS
jgi:plastocyanin